MNAKLLSLLLLAALLGAEGQSYEDKRCRCVCPNPGAVINNTISYWRFYTDNVPPNKCNCDGMILPRIGIELRERAQEFCPQCECKYETRNTTVIMVVVIMVLWILTLLCVYMGFLLCLDTLTKKKKKTYEECCSEEAQNLLLAGNED